LRVASSRTAYQRLAERLLCTGRRAGAASSSHVVAAATARAQPPAPHARPLSAQRQRDARLQPHGSVLVEAPARTRARSASAGRSDTGADSGRGAGGVAGAGSQLVRGPDAAGARRVHDALMPLQYSKLPVRG
jgi:hypothetical protein